jgi:hypothetical protein
MVSKWKVLKYLVLLILAIAFASLPYGATAAGKGPSLAPR